MIRPTPLLTIWLLAAGLATSVSTRVSPATAADRPRGESRPNIVLIMVDDMGYSDLGCFGGEIRTPRIDRLAAEGLRFTQFYNCAKCETTRACLLSGRYHSEVGVGKLKQCVTIAEALRDSGYTTLMTGKWHLASTPIERGFDRYFGHLSGACNFFTGDNTFRLDDEKFDVPAEGFYTTDANTDYALQFLAERDTKKPFFLYVAYNAPHYPLQAPRDEVEKYRGKYQIGWDELRRRRHARQQELGIVDPQWPLAPRPDDVPAWKSLDKKRRDLEDLRMATFAAMVDRVDQNVGRLVDGLREEGALDDTLILFLSDNGACPFERTKPETRQEMRMPWDPKSYWTYDKGWAHACNTPFREYKQNQHEGGISTPLIAHWPRGVAEGGRITDQPGHLVDIMATCLDLAGGSYPSERNGQPVGPPRGLSLLPILEGNERPPHDRLLFTFYGRDNALRQGDWKLVNRNNGDWELYNIRKDRTEQNDLATQQPERARKMANQWKQWADEAGAKRKGKNKKKQ